MAYNIIELNEKLTTELRVLAKEMGIRRPDAYKKEELIYKILDEQAIAETKKLSTDGGAGRQNRKASNSKTNKSTTKKATTKAASKTASKKSEPKADTKIVSQPEKKVDEVKTQERKAPERSEERRVGK